MLLKHPGEMLRPGYRRQHDSVDEERGHFLEGSGSPGIHPLALVEDIEHFVGQKNLFAERFGVDQQPLKSLKLLWLIRQPSKREPPKTTLR